MLEFHLTDVSILFALYLIAGLLLLWMVLDMSRSDRGHLKDVRILRCIIFILFWPWFGLRAIRRM